ncbi:uncharacterized protein LOC130649172 [Hydractinia symbiolongicarpus]|uniref:uncharacterized protein LOC130649172 n=1 Tax=Hydractinia symbiolongicarpus TaxID=13093 RepID=UPI00254D834D|nr:uncharacterized protein LOC130649172 [Hydractinia symbiolongicarpus]
MVVIKMDEIIDLHAKQCNIESVPLEIQDNYKTVTTPVSPSHNVCFHAVLKIFVVTCISIFSCGTVFINDCREEVGISIYLIVVGIVIMAIVPNLADGLANKSFLQLNIWNIAFALLMAMSWIKLAFSLPPFIDIHVVMEDWMCRYNSFIAHIEFIVWFFNIILFNICYFYFLCNLNDVPSRNEKKL